MQANQTAAVPGHLAALFTKANLLLSAGLVTQDAYDLCVGKLRIREPGQGVFVYEFIGGDPASNIDSVAKTFSEAVIKGVGGEAVATQCSQGGSSCPNGFECASYSGGQWGSLQLHLGDNHVPT